MKAVIKPYYDTNRKQLSEIIPLAHPFTVYIEQTRACNFKCFYCIHSTRDMKGGQFERLGYGIKHMDVSSYKEVIKQLGEMPRGIKRIVFSGLGEPLMNPRFHEFVRIAVDSKIADRVEVITNGLLLTPELADKLVEAGITNINISVQGINEKQYEDNCGVKINFEEFVRNLSYLYENKKNTQVYIKAIDATLKTKAEVEEFYRIFGNICDRIYVEHLIVMQQQMDSLKEKVDVCKNLYGEDINIERKVCSPAFYFLQIGCDLDTFPCPVPGLDKGISMGNIKENTIMDIWNGEKRKAILRTMLEGKKDSIPQCQGCTCFNSINNPSENLDKDAHKLINLFQ